MLQKKKHYTITQLQVARSMWNVTTEARSWNRCSNGKAVSITYSDCVFVARVIQHSKRMRHVVISGLSGSTTFFHIISQTARYPHPSPKKVTVHKMCFHFLYNFCRKHFSFWEELSKIWLKMHIGLHVQYQLFLSDFNETWKLSTYFRKILKYQISWKSVQWEPSCSMRTDRLAKATIRNFGNESKTPLKTATKCV